VIAYRATLDVPRELAWSVAKLLLAGRRRGMPRGSRALTRATLSSAPCAAWANGGSPCSPAAGAPCNTSPPAPARSATSSGLRLSWLTSSTATPHEQRWDPRLSAPGRACPGRTACVARRRAAGTKRPGRRARGRAR